MTTQTKNHKTLLVSLAQVNFPQGISCTLLNHEGDILSASVPCQGAGPAVMPVEGLG